MKKSVKKYSKLAETYGRAIGMMLAFFLIAYALGEVENKRKGKKCIKDGRRASAKRLDNRHN